MSDVKPDTSLYSALEMKLHALAKALNWPCDGLLLLEERDPFGVTWVPANGRSTDFMVRLARGCEYRIKPKPRELWAIVRPDGSYWPDPFYSSKPLIYTREPDCAEGNIPVRFVEQPADGP